MSISSEIRCCVLVPTYNNAKTLEAVMKGILAQCSNVIVVNDGCTDGSNEILDRYPQIKRINHPVNQGKGVALKDGLEFAFQSGYTHAITLDSDGQHLPDDLPRMMEALQANPAAMILGVRDLACAGRPLKSRLLRLHSNFWVWIETGRWTHDSQSGFRVYPLKNFAQLKLTSAKYDFEIESLVKFAWLGTPVICVPVRVRYGTGSSSHFRPLVDFWLVTLMNVKLLAMRLLVPARFRNKFIRKVAAF